MPAQMYELYGKPAQQRKKHFVGRSQSCNCARHAVLSRTGAGVTDQAALAICWLILSVPTPGLSWQVSSAGRLLRNHRLEHDAAVPAYSGQVLEQIPRQPTSGLTGPAMKRRHDRSHGLPDRAFIGSSITCRHCCPLCHHESPRPFVQRPFVQRPFSGLPRKPRLITTGSWSDERYGVALYRSCGLNSVL